MTLKVPSLLILYPDSPQTPRRRRNSYLPDTSPARRRSSLDSVSSTATPTTPTHRLLPLESSFSSLDSSCASTASWTDLQSPKLSTPSTPRRRLAALLDTPLSKADPLGVLGHDIGNSSPKHRLPRITPLDHSCQSPCPSSSSPLKRKAKLSLSSPLGSRKQKATLKQSLFPPLLGDSTKLLEVSWNEFPDLSSNGELDDSPPESHTLLSVPKAQSFVEKVQKFVDDQNRYKSELKVVAKRFQRVACARLKGGSETGAILTAKKVRKIEYEKVRVAKAVGLASEALKEMEQELARARVKRNKVSFSGNMNVLEDAEIITNKRPEVKWDRTELLSEVLKWTGRTLAV